MDYGLLINAIIAGLMLGGFYAAVTAGVAISFGMLDIVNIAHPGFIILGSYIAYIVNINFGVDPIVVSIVALPAFYALGALVYQVYYQSFEKRGQESLRGLAFFFGLLFVTEVGLNLVFGVDYRSVNAPYIGPSLHVGRHGVSAAHAGALPGFAGDVRGTADLPVAHLHRPRGDGGVAGSTGAATHGCQSDPHQAHCLRHFHRHRLDGRRLPHHHPAGRSPRPAATISAASSPYAFSADWAACREL